MNGAMDDGSKCGFGKRLGLRAEDGRRFGVRVMVAAAVFATGPRAYARASETPDVTPPADPTPPTSTPTPEPPLSPPENALPPVPPAAPSPSSGAPVTPSPPSASPPPSPATSRPLPDPESIAPEPEPVVEPMSEGRLIVSLYNSGFQWGIAPGVVFGNDKAGFAVAVRFGYGFDLGPVILVPGVSASGYFLDPNAYIGMPTLKVVFPIGGFAPFVEGGVGVGSASEPAKIGLALMGGAGFMVHFSVRFGLGVEGTYQTISGTGFDTFGVGPILALGF